MLRLAIATVVAGVVAGAVATAGVATPAAKDYQRCAGSSTAPGPFTVRNVRVDGTSCKRARKVTKEFVQETVSGGDFPNRVGAWSCSTAQSGSGSFKTVCRRSGKRIKFLTGG